MAFPKIGYRSIIDTASTLTATSEASGFPITNIRQRRVFLPWKATSLIAQDIDIDMGSATAADYIALAGHNLASENITLTLKADAAFPPTTVKATIVPADYPASGVFLKEFATQTLRYWRISLSAASANVAYVGVVYLGAILTFTAHLTPSIDPNVEVIEGSLERAEGGHALGAIVRRIGRDFVLSIDPAGALWTDLFSPANMINDFWKNHARKLRPFFFNPNIAEPTIFDTLYLVATPDARFDRPLVGQLYNRRTFSLPVVSAIAEAA